MQPLQYNLNLLVKLLNHQRLGHVADGVLEVRETETQKVKVHMQSLLKKSPKRRAVWVAPSHPRLLTRALDLSSWRSLLWGMSWHPVSVRQSLR